MAYEYNPESSRFNLPNPHRVENVMLAATAAVMLGLGVYGLFMVRDALRAEDLSGVAAKFASYGLDGQAWNIGRVFFRGSPFAA